MGSDATSIQNTPRSAQNLVEPTARMHTGVQIYLRTGREERGRILLAMARKKLYGANVPALPEGNYHVLGLEDSSIQHAYEVVVAALDELDPAWRESVDVLAPPDPAS